MEILKKIKAQLLTGDPNDYPRINTREVINLPIHIVMPNPNQPRKTFDHDSLRELADSVREYGILQPVTVRKKTDGTYELVAGERRLRAAALAGLLKIPAIVTDMEDTKSAMVGLIENIQRQNLNFIEEALAYREVIDRFNLTQEKLASKLGKTQSFVANKLRLLKLPRSVIEIIRDNSLTERHARCLLRLDSEEKQISAATRMCDLSMGVRQSEEMVDRIIRKGIDIKPAKKMHRSISDVRVFFKTISKAVSLMNENGIEASAKKDETDNYYEYTIRIQK